MVRKASYSILTRIVCVVLAIHFFNFSVDPADKHSDSVPEDLSVNDIESVSELVIEVVFGYGDVFGEHDERDTHHGGRLGICKIYISNAIFQLNNLSPNSNSSSEFHIADCRRMLSRTTNVLSPPPKV
jgi:hypothetical protein